MFCTYFRRRVLDGSMVVQDGVLKVAQAVERVTLHGQGLGISGIVERRQYHVGVSHGVPVGKKIVSLI